MESQMPSPWYGMFPDELLDEIEDDEGLSDDEMNRMVAEHEEEAMAQAEMESSAFLKFTAGEWL